MSFLIDLFLPVENNMSTSDVHHTLTALPHLNLILIIGGIYDNSIEFYNETSNKSFYQIVFVCHKIVIITQQFIFYHQSIKY
jgi:hypothetical protein